MQNDFEPACSAATIDAAMDRAVTTLLPFLQPGSRVLDVGSGWCGPLSIFADAHGCNVTGVTVSRRQAAHCREQGRLVVLGDVEATDTQVAVAASADDAGQYDAAVLMESLTHIQDKPALLRWLRTQAPRLILRVNTRPDDDDVPAEQAPPLVFGGSMVLQTADELRQTLEAAGWRIKHWQNERSAATPTLDAYKSRLDALAAGAGNGTQVGLLRSLVELNDGNNETWADTHGLITVVAVRGDGAADLGLAARPAAERRSVTVSACEAGLDTAVEQLERLLSAATQIDVLPSPSTGSDTPGFGDLFRCVAGALRQHADAIRVPTQDGAVSADACPDAAFWRRHLLRLSSKTKLDPVTGRLVASVNRYSVGVPRTMGTPIQRQVARTCMASAMAAPRVMLEGMLKATDDAAKQTDSASEGELIELGVSWPNADRSANGTRSGRLYIGRADRSDDIVAFEWAMDGQDDAARIAGRGYRQAPAGREHASCVEAALATAIPAKGGFAEALATASGCWVSDRGSKGVKRDLKLARPIKIASMPEMLRVQLPVVSSRLAAELGLAVTVIAVQPDAFTLYFQHVDGPSLPSIAAPSTERTQVLVPMPHYQVPANLKGLPLIPAIDQDEFFRDVFGRRSRHFKNAAWQGAATAALAGLDVRSMLGAAQEQSSIRWKINTAEVTGDLKAELEGDLEATWAKMTSPAPVPTAGQISAVLGSVETYTADPRLSKLHEDLSASLGFAIGINAYFSAPDATALTPHTDPYDVLVVQLQGHKRWKVCLATADSTVAADSMTESDAAEVLELKKHNPLGCTRVEGALEDPELACTEVAMGPGDVLYLPKGIVHTATTVNDTLSAHLTISLKRDGLRWGDLFSAVCGQAPHAGCPSLDRLAAAAPMGVAWLRPFPVWLGAGVDKNPEVLQHFADLRRQLEHFDDSNRNTRAALDGHVFDGAVRPRVTVEKLMAAMKHGWRSSLGARRPGEAVDVQLPPFMQVDVATGRTRRGACDAGDLFRCANGQLQPYAYSGGGSCTTSCDARGSCGCDGYCKDLVTPFTRNPHLQLDLQI